MAKRLRNGTACMVKSIYYPAHNGKVVVVLGYSRKRDTYRCSPQLYDEDGLEMWWFRESLRPLNGGDGGDEMLRFAGLPQAEGAR